MCDWRGIKMMIAAAYFCGRTAPLKAVTRARSFTRAIGGQVGLAEAVQHMTSSHMAPKLTSSVRDIHSPKPPFGSRKVPAAL